MKRENVFKIGIISLIVLTIIFIVIIFVNKDNNPRDFSTTAKQLAQNHFNFVRIFEHSVLEYDSETGKVTDTTYSTYADFEKAIKETYDSEYANDLLNGDDAVYYNKDGKLYVNIDNASHAGVYTGNGDIVVTIKEQTKTKVEFEAKISAYVDAEKQNVNEVVYTMIAEKQDNNWKLTEVK